MVMEFIINSDEEEGTCRELPKGFLLAMYNK